MKKKVPAWLILMIISIAAGGVLGFTNELTRGPIAVNSEREADAARKALFTAADSFELEAPDAVSGLDNCYAAYKGDELVGYLAQATVQGFGGPIEVLVGMDMNKQITGVNVGGADFSETPGLGAKTKDAAFRDQFTGISMPVQLGQNVDAVTSATISSTAVVGAVNTVGDYLAARIDAAGSNA